MTFIFIRADQVSIIYRNIYDTSSVSFGCNFYHSANGLIQQLKLCAYPTCFKVTFI